MTLATVSGLQTHTGYRGGQVQRPASRRRVCLTMRSSREWKEITPRRPPGRSDAVEGVRRPILTGVVKDTADTPSPDLHGPREACGVFGVYAPGQQVSATIYFGLFALQHRGQEAAGIATSDGETVTVVKDLGLVPQVFDENDLAALEGHIGIAEPFCPHLSQVLYEAVGQAGGTVAVQVSSWASLSSSIIACRSPRIVLSRQAASFAAHSSPLSRPPLMSLVPSAKSARFAVP